MNYHGYKITEKDNGFYVFALLPFSDPELAMETFEFYVANTPQATMSQYLMHCDFDNVTLEKVLMNPMDLINNNFPSEAKCMNVSNEYVSLIPPPKPKREAKKKAEPKEPKPAKPRGKKSTQKVEISLNKQNVDMS